MRQFINIVEGKSSSPYGKSVLYRGFYFKKMGEFEQRVRDKSYICDRYLVMFPDGRPAARFDIDKASRADGGYWNIHSWVHAEHQRKGIGTIMYDFAEELARKAGTQIMPSPFLSPSSHAFWTKRDPERLQAVQTKVLRLGDGDPTPAA